MKKIISLILVCVSILSCYSCNDTSTNPDPDTKTFGALKWKFKTNGRIYSSPTLENGVIYIGSEDKNLYAIEASSGAMKWAFTTGGAVHSTPAVYKDVVYAGSFDGYYYAIDAKTGKERWRFKTEGEKHFGSLGYWGMQPADMFMADPWDYFLSSPILDKNDADLTVYFGSSDGNLYAVNAVNGTLKWNYKTQNVIHTTPVLNNDLIYISSWDALHAIDIKTKKEKWSFYTGDNIYMSGIQSTVAVDGGNVYLGTRDGVFFALNAETGSKVWSDSLNSAWVIGSARVKNGHVYVGTSDSFLMLSLNALTGAEEFRFKANGYVFDRPFVTDKKIYFGDYTGKMFEVDISSAAKQGREFATEGRKANAAQVLNNDYLDFQFLFKNKDQSLYSSTTEVMNEFDKLGPIVSSPVVENGIIYFGSADGNLYSIILK
jgi:outer membrane protein assembly factor BamB